MAAILYFFDAAHSRSHFLSDFLQNLGQGTLMSYGIYYRKSENSVGNFRQYGQPRFQKKSKMAAKNKMFEIRQVRCQFLLIQTR